MERVDPLWKVVQAGLDERVPIAIAEHPYVRFYMLNEGRFPDFLQMARELNRDILESIVEKHREHASDALDAGPGGEIEPTSRTAMHLYYVTRMLDRFGDLRQRRVCEIGGGYGNLMRICVQLGLCAGYDIVDIAGVVDLQRRYADSVLSPQQRATVDIVNIEVPQEAARLTARPYDLVTSFYGITEAPHDMRQWYLDHLLRPAAAVYLVAQERWRNQEVGAHVRDGLADRFDLSLSRFYRNSDHESDTHEMFGERSTAGSVSGG